jgi:hypothetical protein
MRRTGAILPFDLSEIGHYFPLPFQSNVNCMYENANYFTKANVPLILLTGWLVAGRRPLEEEEKKLSGAYHL